MIAIRRSSRIALLLTILLAGLLRPAAGNTAVPPVKGELYLAPFVGLQTISNGSTEAGPAVGSALSYAPASGIVIEPEFVFGTLSKDIGVFFTATANLLYYIQLDSRVTPYFGGGLGAGIADGTDFFLQVGGGVDLANITSSATLRLDLRVGFLTVDQTNNTLRPGVFFVLPLK
jgi:hypothetical protein